MAFFTEANITYEVSAVPHQEGVTFSLVVSNGGDAPITYQFFTGQEYDFAVNSGEVEVWRWSREMMFIQSLHNLTLLPGETLTYEEFWDYRDNSGKRVPPGTYTLRAWFYGFSKENPVAVIDFLIN